MKYIHILRKNGSIPYILKFINKRKDANHTIFVISSNITFEAIEDQEIHPEKMKLTVVSGDLDYLSEKLADELLKEKSKVIVW